MTELLHFAETRPWWTLVYLFVITLNTGWLCAAILGTVRRPK